MAQKIITDLQLISSVTDSLNFPADNGIQSYRATAAQIQAYILAAGKINNLNMFSAGLFNGLTGVTPLAGDSFLINDASDSNALKKCTVASIRNSPYRAVSNPSSEAIGADDGTIKVSGTSGTLVLPAAGNAGKRYKIIHAGTSLTQVYTMNTTGGSTIGGVASGSYKLCTNGEVLEVEDDGTDWTIVGRSTNTPWIDAGAITVTATTTNPTKANTPTSDKVKWIRRGRNALINWKYAQNVATGSNAGSGIYQLNMPSGLVIDTSEFGTIGSSTGYDESDDMEGFIASGGYIIDEGGSHGTANLLVYDSTKFKVRINQYYSAVSNWSSSLFQMSLTSIAYGFWAEVPIVDFRP